MGVALAHAGSPSTSPSSVGASVARAAVATLAARVGNDDARRIAVVHHGANVERVVGEEDAHLGALRYRLAFVGLFLRKSSDGRRVGPRRIAEHITVERRRLGRTCGSGDVGGASRK